MLSALPPFLAVYYHFSVCGSRSDTVHAVTLITHEPIAAAMAGPAIRVAEMARVLSESLRVRVASPYPVERDLGSVDARRYRFGDDDSLRAAIDGSDVVVVQGFTLEKFPFLAASSTCLVVDLYCPFQLENLERRRCVEPSSQIRAHDAAVDLAVLQRQLRRGDYFLCASERQRDYWLGMLSAAGRLNPATYEPDRMLRALIDVVPFGLPERPATRTGPGFKGRVRGIDGDDRIIIWGGSVLDWHDALTPIRAMTRVIDDVPGARLVFPVGSHPSPELPTLSMLDGARRLARELGLLDRHVFFTDWMPYDDRVNYLLEAEIGLSAHQVSLETRFAWRTRILDYIWVGLPIVCNDGDSMADLVASRGLGFTPPSGDVEAMATALLTLLQDPDAAATCRRHVEPLRPSLTWTRVVEPLRAYCERASRAPDAGGTATAPQGPPRARRSVPRRLAAALKRLVNR